MACVLLWSSAVRVHDSQAYRKMDVTRQRISCILELQYSYSEKSVCVWGGSGDGTGLLPTSSIVTGVGATQSMNAVTCNVLCFQHLNINIFA